MHLSKKTLVKAALVCVSSLIALVIGEASLRILSPRYDGYCIYPPHLNQVLHPLSAILPGVQGESRFITNSRGVRDDELTAQYTYKVLAVGGSTTECLYLDQEEAWPYLVQKTLNERQHDAKVWVGNVGKSGLSTRDHVVELRYLLKQYAEIDALILLVGVNDLAFRLGQDSDYDPHFLDRPGAERRILFRTFSNARELEEPAYKRTSLWRLFSTLKPAPGPPRNFQDPEGRMYVRWREHRQNAAAIRQALPDLTSALQEYSQNINTIIDLAQSRSIRLIFVTQPVLWNANLPKDLNDLLWLGGVGDFQAEGGKQYYSAEALSRAMGTYNSTLIETCRQRHVECFDLAPLLPKDTTIFYDDAHFNENGARSVAAALAMYLLEHGSLKKS
jgi:lysophospholipase L1-like esterase